MISTEIKEIVSMKLAIIGAFSSSFGYAVLLSTPTGRQFRLQYTWLSVVVGVALTLGWIYTVSRRSAAVALGFFALTGTPVATMCILEDMARRQEAWRFQANNRD
jgi:hypothetical protein